MYPEIFTAQTQWVADNKAALNVQAVIHEGDIVEHGTDAENNNALEWGRADTSWQILDNAEIPYVVACGNHDYNLLWNGNGDRTATAYNAYFGQSRYTAHDWWNGGFYETGLAENLYLLLTIGGVDYIIVSLEFGPRDAVLAWASGLLDTYASRIAIIVTHSYMYRDGTRVGPGDEHSPKSVGYGLEDANDGEDMWTNLVKLKGNIVLVQGGHDLPGGAARRTDTGDNGNAVHQILANFQSPIEANGGNGYLRVAIFRPSTRQIFMRTYSPTLDAFKAGSAHAFNLSY